MEAIGTLVVGVGGAWNNARAIAGIDSPKQLKKETKKDSGGLLHRSLDFDIRFYTLRVNQVCTWIIVKSKLRSFILPPKAHKVKELLL